MSLCLTRFARYALIVLSGIGLLDLAACTRPRTQIMVRLGTDMTQGAGNELPAIRVQVTGEEAGAVHYDQTLQLGTGGVTLPQELGLVPAKRKSALVTVQVDALDGSGGVIFTKRVSTHYVPDKTLLLDIFLASRCLDSAARVCPTDQSCGGAGCESDTRTNLPEYEGPPTGDGGITRDFAVAADLAGADLTAGEPDLNVVPEPDLLGADLVGSDFTVVVADMASPPDLIVPDLKVLPDFSGVDLSAAPVITNLTPANVVLGIDGLTITGMRLVSGTTSVTINGVAQTISTSSATEIVIAQVNTATPPGNGVDVVVLTDAGPGMAPINILPRLAMTKAESKSATEVEVTFNRAVNAGTVQSAEFTIAGLTVSGASASGAVVTLTTTNQQQGTAYALHVTDAVKDTFATSLQAHVIGFGGPAPTEFVVVLAGNGVTTSSQSLSIPVVLERRSIASPSSVGASIEVPTYDTAAPPTDMAGPAPFAVMANNTAEGSLSRSPDGQKLAMMGYKIAAGVAGSANVPPSGVRVALIADHADFASVDGLQMIDTGQFTGVQARSAVVAGNNVWVSGGDTGIWTRTIDGTGAFSKVSEPPRSGRVLGIWNGQLYVTTSEIPTGSPKNVFKVGDGLPTGTASADIIDTDTATGQPYGFAFFDVSEEPGDDLLYLFDEALGIQKFVKQGGDWTSRGSFSGGIRHGTCYLQANDTVCIGTTSGSILRMVDVGHAQTSGSSTAIATAPTNKQFRGLALAPIP